VIRKLVTWLLCIVYLAQIAATIVMCSHFRINEELTVKGTQWSIIQDSQVNYKGFTTSSDTCPPHDELYNNDPKCESYSSYLCIKTIATLTWLQTDLLPIFLSSISFDFIIFVFTIRKGLNARRKEDYSRSLLAVLVKGGNIYFM